MGTGMSCLCHRPVILLSPRETTNEERTVHCVFRRWRGRAMQGRGGSHCVTLRRRMTRVPGVVEPIVAFCGPQQGCTSDAGQCLCDRVGMATRIHSAVNPYFAH